MPEEVGAKGGRGFGKRKDVQRGGGWGRGRGKGKGTGGGGAGARSKGKVEGGSKGKGGSLLDFSSQSIFVPLTKEEPPTLFITDTLDGWLQPEGNMYTGLLVKRPFAGMWDCVQGDIDEARPNFGSNMSNLTIEKLVRVRVNESQELLPARLSTCADEILSAASLPDALSKQIHADACAIGKRVGSLCPSAHELEVKLEIIGDYPCQRWHQDNYVGRAIVTYTGHTGTDYTRHSNVDFWELNNCGNSDCIIREKSKIRNVGVGDILFMKGTRYPYGAKGLVHKSPEKRYHKDGRILNRLILKIDVKELRSE
jgi:hypothetical protein